MAKESPEEGTKLSIPAREEKTLEFWNTEAIFSRSLEERKDATPFVFYDGPPFATGLPHHGHLLQGTIKDVIPRYQSMKGRSVRRVWGWDCHGLPVENLVEAELGLKHKKDIEAYGVKNFNEKARASVMRYDKEWKTVVPRMGRWVDMNHPYRTMDSEYTESVWWAFKTLYAKRLIYEGYKSMHLCPRCETTLSNFEVVLGYKEVKDISVYVKFPVEGENNTYFLAWTTTPWTLPGNVALAVGSDIEYVKVKATPSVTVGDKKEDGSYHEPERWEEFYFFAKSRFQSISEIAKKILVDIEIVGEIIKGKDLVGRSYTPIFDSFAKNIELKNHERGWKVYAADFVTTEEGTGIVHIAPAFGEDDMKLGERERLPFIQHVKTDGTVLSDVKELAGLEVKPKGEDNVRLGTDITVLKYLQEKGSFFAKENITHPYPHCWRCDTPLLNYASTSWFVKATAIKDDLIRENKKITWVPENVRDGRFGNWLENVRDWAISRSRYWGAPIPVWRCGECKDVTVVGSLAELRANMSHRNAYILMRHGEAQSNATGVVNGKKDAPNGLTEVGKREAKASGKALKEKTIDLIVASPFLRAKETAKAVAVEIGYDPKRIQYDERLGEIQTGEFEGKPIESYRGFFNGLLEKFTKRPKKGENLNDVRTRVVGVLNEIDKKHQGKTILIVTHEYPAWMLVAASEGMTTPDAVKDKERRGEDFLPTAGFEDLSYAPLPHNDKGEIDFHRPYIDEVTLHCRCGGDMKRIPEVFDCWFESGSMPYAQFHYLGNDTTDAGVQFRKNFPADFIAEAVDQTRGWFYNMLVLSVGLFGESAFKRVICTGLILAEDGQKMSKKLKNYPDVMEVVNTYGADALRLYMLSSPVVRGENLNFSLSGIEDLYKKVFLRTENVRAFYELYADRSNKLVKPKGTHVLDRWVLSRLSELAKAVAFGLDRFEMDSATRGIPQFVDDLSTWYLRRSRDRLKGDDEGDKLQATQTLRYVLLRFSQVIAPIMPFFAEDLYASVKGDDAPMSVHLTEWPKEDDIDRGLLEDMAAVRQIVSQALEVRAREGIKVRQPLGVLTVPRAISDEYHSIIKDEVNIKTILVNEKQEGIRLDTALTPELKKEGEFRDTIRATQEARKDSKLLPSDMVVLKVFASAATAAAIQEYEEEYKKAVNATSVEIIETTDEKFRVEVAKAK